MRVRTDFPRSVRTIESTWIPMRDGTRLSARVWLPADAERDPVPAILEYIPYRKTDATATRDALLHPYFAGFGYAAVRVDLRGSGDSEGILLGEYLEQEQDDALDVLRWLAEQPWCTGAVGIIGKSWGGFNGLQIAGRRPPELKAVVTVCSTDDRYADDMHYKGGCLLGSEMLSWATAYQAFSLRPPDPEVVGGRWRDMWLERLEKAPAIIEDWLGHQTLDAFWKHGSVCEDFSAIEAAVYAVGGWGDPYANAIPRLMSGLRCPRKALVGPWAHVYPHQGLPGPAIGFLQECVRWWDHWLKGIDTGIMDEPEIRVWMQDAVEPRTSYDERPGRWVSEPSWPSPNVAIRGYALGAGTLGSGRGGPEPLEIASAPGHGIRSGAWLTWGKAGDFPPDQRSEDGLSLTFDSPPLDERLEIHGAPDVRLTLSSDRPRALVAVRLCDVAPDGTSSLVTRGVLNLTHRDSHEHPEPLVPGERYEVTVGLDAVAYAFPAGHRLRLAVSPTYWPWIWPSPEAVTLSVHTGEAGELRLPVRAPGADEPALADFGPAEFPPPLDVEILRAARGGRRVEYDIADGAHELIADIDWFGGLRLPNAIEYDEWAEDRCRVADDDPLSATASSSWRISIGRGAWRTRVEAEIVLTGDHERFLATTTVKAYEGEVRCFERASTASIPRELL